MNVLSLIQVEGATGGMRSENEFPQTSGTRCVADHRSLKGNLRNFQCGSPTALTRPLPPYSPQQNQGSAYRSYGRGTWGRTDRRKERRLDWRRGRRRNWLLDRET